MMFETMKECDAADLAIHLCKATVYHLKKDSRNNEDDDGVCYLDDEQMHTLKNAMKTMHMAMEIKARSGK